MECLAFMFTKKHQSIAKIVQRHVYPKFVWILTFIFTGILPFVFLFGAWAAGMTKEQQFGYIKEHYPQYLKNFQSLDNFAIYEFNIWYIVLTVIAFFGGILAGFGFTFYTFDMLKMLEDARKKVSQSNYQKHKSAIRSLLAQFATSSICLMPPFLYIVVVVLEVENAQTIMQCIVVLLTLHSPANALVLIMTVVPYRNFVFGKVLKTNLDSIKVVSITAKPSG